MSIKFTQGRQLLSTHKCVAELQAGGWWWGAWLLILHDFKPRRLGAPYVLSLVERGWFTHVDVSECVAYSAHESDVIRSRRTPCVDGPIVGTERKGF
jgi:hypothetical protein